MAVEDLQPFCCRKPENLLKPSHFPQTISVWKDLPFVAEKNM